MEQKPLTLVEQIGWGMSLTAFCVMTVGTFWTMVCRKVGSIGPKMYALYILPCLFVMAVLLAGSQSSANDQMIFHVAIPATVVLYSLHLVTAVGKRLSGNHVHTYHVGMPRFGYPLEVIAGFCVGALFIFFNAPYFGWFVIASAFCCGMTIGMFRERDRMRGYVMKDAELEMERMEQIYGERD